MQEFKKWCPAFKILTYFGSPKERKAKRMGWSKPNSFHVCITTYTLILQVCGSVCAHDCLTARVVPAPAKCARCTFCLKQDQKMFRRKKWKYLILDEAHMIKNWKSQRWQTLLNFQSKRRLLITGTPLQVSLVRHDASTLCFRSPTSLII